MSKYEHAITISNRFYRLIWGFFYYLFFRYSPFFLFKWRNLILRIFGAKISPNVEIYPSCKIWSPKNLIIDENSGIGPGVNIYNVAPIIIGKNVNISQDVYLCTATHDYTSSNFQLCVSEIKIHDKVWIAAKAFISYGVTINQCAIVGAASYVYKDILECEIVSGNPAVKIGIR